jgi:hypothetical protein
MTRVDPETGEVLSTAVAVYDPQEYLASLSTGAGLRHQQQLAAAYDAACAALIGDNDVQVEGGRSFKKKSAWRKLARHFRVSVEIVKVERDHIAGHFVAIVTARAVAPWGQSYEEIGACSTDEATGRRVISVADAIATASTRASNRAVSNLIAMGEVSAEEIGDRPAQASAPRRAAPPASGKASGATMPFGKTKGQPLSELSDDEISGAVKWATEKGKFAEFVQDGTAELVRRGKTPAAAPAMEAAPLLDDPEDALPF